MRRNLWMFLAFLLFPVLLQAEVIGLAWQRKGVKKPEQVVYGVDLRTGNVVWEHRFGEEVNFVEKVGAGFLAGCGDGTLTLLEPTKGAVVGTKRLGERGEEVNTFRGEFAAGFLVSSHDEAFWLVSPRGERFGLCASGANAAGR
ncbi:MAG: hypothetical protein NZ869_10940 [Thermoanaerobaculum sp.]|nr:hypothetical protein [Thermoanaerobaculum sp.]MDW7967475.1 hypothetical protein [Thermoanaerobaculum sp.]